MAVYTELTYINMQAMPLTVMLEKHFRLEAHFPGKAGLDSFRSSSLSTCSRYRFITRSMHFLSHSDSLLRLQSPEPYIKTQH